MRVFVGLCLSGMAGISMAFAQARVHLPALIDASFTCNYTGAVNPKTLCSDANIQSNGHAERVVDRILKPIGLLRNFSVMECPNTENCFATVVKGERFIIYDGAFMAQIEEDTETDWSAISIMAHEIGHHLQGHTIDGKGGQPQKEIEADRFSGFVLHQLGASLDESMVAIRALGNDHATRTHPAKGPRMEAVRKGWVDAEELYPRRHGAGDRAPATAVASTRPGPSVMIPTRPAAERSAVATSRVGCLSGDCEDGTGVFVFPTKDRYEGEFAEGDKHGEGTEYYPDGRVKYRGSFEDDLRAGMGAYAYRNGDKYVGQFAQNLPNGKGTYYFHDGDRFVGYFRNGKRHGYGVQYNASGQQQTTGTWQDDRKVR